MDIVIFGYGYLGTILAKRIKNDPNYSLIGFADNSKYKQGYYAYGSKIMSMEELAERKNISVIVASEQHYEEIINECLQKNVRVEGVFLEGRIKKYPWINFENLKINEEITLYAGDIVDDVHLNNENVYGLSITHCDDKHISHDVTKPYPLPDNCIASYESECVFEMIGEENIPFVLDEIYRILKPGGWLRIVLPDYYSPYLKERSMRDEQGNVVYDAGETYAIKYGKEGLIGGTIWYSNYDSLNRKIKDSKFSIVDWSCYHTADGSLKRKEIDITKGFIRRVNNNSLDEDVYCMVVDLYKEKNE